MMLNKTFWLTFYSQSPALRKTSGEGGQIDKKTKFAEFKKFESIPSQEVLNVIQDGDIIDEVKSSEDMDKQRRTQSQEFKLVSLHLIWYLCLEEHEEF